MDSFTLYVTLRADRPVHDATVDAVAGVLRPDGEELRIWRDEEDATLLRISVDCVAADLESALEHGHRLAAQIALGPGSTVEEVGP